MGYTISNSASIQTIVFKVANFINPFSITEITGITATYSNSVPTVVETSTGYTMTGFTASVMTVTPTLTSSSQVIGSFGQTLTVSFTTVGILQTSGQIQLIFPAYTSSENFIESTSPDCAGTLVLKSSFSSCTFNTATQTLTITGILSSNQVGGTAMSFTVDNLRNPYSAIPRTGFTLYTEDSVGGWIDMSTAGSLTVTTFAAFTNPVMQRQDGNTTVDELSTLQPYFELGTLAVDADTCRFRIDFPSDMPITSSLTSESGVGLFSSASGFHSIYTGSSFNYLEIDGCTQYTSTQDPADVGVVFLSSVQNKAYVQETSTFTFTLYAVVGATYYNIAQSTSSLTFDDFTPGQIYYLNVQPVTTYNVQSSTTFQVYLRPSHNIPASSKITIAFPSTISLSSGTCTIGTTTGSITSTGSSCAVSSNILTLTDPFGSSSYAATSSTFSFIFSTSGTNPASTASIGTFTVNTYAVVSGASYSIDTGTFSNLYVASATQMVASLAIGSTVACTSGSTYTITATNQKYIPASGTMQVIFPTTVFLSASALTSCQVTTSAGTFTLSTSSQCVVASTSPITINISGCFSSQLSTGGTIVIAMVGITNPTSLSTTSSFSLYTMDASGNQIEYATSGMTVQMGTLSPLTSFQAAFVTASNTNGAIGNILITVTVTCPLSTGSVLYFTLPAEIGVTSGTTSCAKVSGTGLTSVSCSPSTTSVTATLVISSTLSSGTQFSFKVKSITNPSSTCVTSAFSAISIYDSSGNEINSYTGTYPTLQTTTPATATGSLAQTSQTLSASTTYIITYDNVNYLPVGTTFAIGYPSIVTIPSSFSTCLVQVGGSSYGMTCSSDSTLQLIYLTTGSSNGITTIIAASSTVQITLGLITNPSTQTSTTSTFTLMSYTSTGCSIDEVTSGMVVGYTCDSPCLSCTSVKTVCTSCNQNDPNGYIYLYSNTCISACPTGYYADSSNKCQQCMTQCLTCTTGTTCATCNTASSSTYRIFYDNNCVTSCPTGYYTPTGTTSCSQCDSSCLTCSTSSTNCLTCNTSATTDQYFYSNTCLTSCPSSTVAIDYQCDNCTSPCLTCSVGIAECVTCISNYYLYGTTCVSSCPSQTVAQTTTSPNSCLTCGDNCKTCSSSDTSTCLSCLTGYFLYEGSCINSCPTGTYSSTSSTTFVTSCQSCDSTCKTCSGSYDYDCTTCNTGGTYPYYDSGQCLTACPTGYVSINKICKACTSPCSTCTVSQTECVTCISSYYLYLSTCLSTCPSGTVAQTSTTPDQCTVCPSYCNNCSSSNASYCTVCDFGYYLYEGACYSTCPTGTYLPSDTTTCTACSSPCLGCNATSTNCTSCNSSSTYPALLSNTCLETCPTGYIDSSNVCKACTSPCLTCSVDVTNCNTCVSGYYYYQNSCVKTCPSGTTKSGLDCIGCTTSCATCNTNASECLQCNTGYYLYNYGCYKTCPGVTIADNTSQSCIAPSPSSSSSTSSSSSSKPSSSSSSVSNITTNVSNSTGNVTNTTTADEADKTYLYFPVSTTQTILGGVALGSHFKDPTSLLHSNTLAIWAPLEFIAYGGQTYMAYVQEIRKQTEYDFVKGDNYTFDDPNITSSTSSSTTTGRILRQKRNLTYNAATSASSNSEWPLVFYGTAASFVMLIVTNSVWGIVHFVLVRKDAGYKDHRTRHCCAPICVAICSCMCSFKMGRLHHARFFGLDMFSMQYDKPKKVHNILGALSIVNLVLTLLPIVFVDIYGLIMHKWGNQFYIMVIETFILALTTIFITVMEFKHSKIQPPQDYSKLNDSLNDDTLMQKIDDEIRRRLGGQGLEDLLERLRREKGLDEKPTLKGLGKSSSMIDLNRDLEEDDRRVNTEPLDPEKKKAYLSKPNPFPRKDDPEHPNNCYAEPGRLPKNIVDPANRRVKVIQTGERVMEGDEYDKEFEQKMRDLFGKNDLRPDERAYGNKTDEDEGNTKRKNRNKMRGRKDKYYEQVDNEDMNFAEDAHGRLLDEDGKEDDEDQLDKIDEESQNDDDDEEEKAKILLQEQLNQKAAEEERQKQLALEKEQERLRLEEEERQREQQEQMQSQQEEQIIQDTHEDNLQDKGELLNLAEDEGMEGDALGNEGLDEEIKEHPQEQNPDGREDQKQLEESIIKDIPQKEEIKEEPKFEDIYNPKLATTADMENQLLAEATEETGEVDEDDDNDARIRNMTNPDLRKFNVHDILGDLDRDEKGNVVMLQNKKGELVDKQGKGVNEKGYLIDEKTGDIVEKEKGKKVFDKKDLDERGELPPPFNIERFNFNPHDVRGAFDRDPQTGEEIIGNKKNDRGQLIDKLGRRINEHGYLVDEQGNIVDKRGRIRLHHKQLDSEGNIPLLFNYKGKKYDIKDVIGDFDKDRNGNIIIRRDRENKMVDKKGRRVNSKGYLVDNEGNVINTDGKVVFDHFALSKDNEIPKFFPFLKFNVEDIKGDYEMDPLGNPMLQKNPSGDLLDNKGRKVNEKGYLIDDNGNIKNKRGFKVFGRTLVEDDGEIPKVFRTGLFRKDTVDSFSQLMNEIEDLEKQHELGENGYRKPQPQTQKKANAGEAEDENERIARRIEQIVEEDNDDDDQIMKELEELANIRDGEGENGSEGGGNTSVDSKMEDTPSNYNLANQRFMEQEQMRERVRQQLGKGQVQYDDDVDNESEYMQMPGKKIKRRKKKPKKKKKPIQKEPEVDVRDLMMAKAYGGLSANQVDKIIMERKRKEIGGQSMMRPPINKNASNSRLGSMQSRRVVPGRDDGDNRSEWEGSNLNMIDTEGRAIARGKFGITENAQSTTNRNREAGRSQAKRIGGGYLMEGVQKNNLMGSTQNSFKENNSSQKSFVPRHTNNIGDQTENNRDRRLSNIANSVSGFYREHTLSEASKLKSTHESIAAQLPGGLKRRAQQQDDDDEEGKQVPGNSGDGYDPELDRIYGAAKGFGDISMMSDWEKDSAMSGQSGFTQITGVNNNKKIRGLESIYLQRLEPASKGKVTKKKKYTAEEKAKFRIMHNQVHDEPQWHVDDQRDELDSVLSDNYRQMEKKFGQDFKPSERKKNEVGDDTQRPNIFHGNFYQYKEKEEKKRQQSMLDFEK